MKTLGPEAERSTLQPPPQGDALAYPTHIAAALSGTTPRQLDYWRRPNAADERLFAPDLGKAHGAWRYSFRDLVALRTFAYLREHHSLQKIRRAVQDLRDFGTVDHLSECSLWLSGDDIIWEDGQGNFTNVGGGKKSKHTRLIATLADVFAPFENVQGDEVVDLYAPRPNIEVDPGTLAGYPVIRGTRIEFDLIGSLVEDGVPPERISEMYPSVTADAARDALDFTRAVERLRSEAAA